MWFAIKITHRNSEKIIHKSNVVPISNLDSGWENTPGNFPIFPRLCTVMVTRKLIWRSTLKCLRAYACVQTNLVQILYNTLKLNNPCIRSERIPYFKNKFCGKYFLICLYIFKIFPGFFEFSACYNWDTLPVQHQIASALILQGRFYSLNISFLAWSSPARVRPSFFQHLCNLQL